MTTLDVIIKLARDTAPHKSKDETLWLYYGPLVLGYYPKSGTWNWFDKSGPITKGKAADIIAREAA